MSVKLLTPVPPVHVQVVVQATVVPLRETKAAHWEPDVAPEAPKPLSVHDESTRGRLLTPLVKIQTVGGTHSNSAVIMSVFI